MKEVIFHLGSNVGNRQLFIKEALDHIGKEIGQVVAQSSYYETEPWGVSEQDDFINIAIVVRTICSPRTILTKIKTIEKNIGRQKEIHWGPRVIDIDIIGYGDEVINDRDLKIPHSELPNRNFVLIPLMEIAGEWMHPEMGKTIEELYIESTDVCDVRLIEL